MGMKLSRGPHLDLSELKREAEEIQPVREKLREKAIEFMNEKDALEKAIEKIKEDESSDIDKDLVIKILEDSITEKQKEFDREVSEKRAELDQEQEEIIEKMEKEAQEFQKQSDDLTAMQQEYKGIDASDAIDAATKKKQEILEAARAEADRLKNQIEQHNQQHRYMQRNNISRRR